jgi:hypothetical protein
MIFGFIFLVFLTYLLIRFRLINVSDKKDFLSILPVFIILGLFFHFLSVFYLFTRDKLLSYTVNPIISSIKDFENFKKGEDLIINCRVSRTMPFIHENFVSCKQIPFDDDDFVVRKTPPLELELKDGKIKLDNEDYLIMNWLQKRDSLYLWNFLTTGTEVIITGSEVKKSTEHDRFINGEIVFAGSCDDFIQKMKKDAIFPAFMFYLCLISGLFVWSWPPIYFFYKKRI